MRCLFAIVGLCLLSVATRAQESKPRSQALSPRESMGMIQLDSAFEVNLLAHEPMVIDPVDAAFDDRGRLWVVEMRDYPYPNDRSPSGCVRILSDQDADGHYDTATTFADRLDMPTGIALWKDGALVTLAGQLVWMRDTNDDAVVDTQQIWLEGFTRENEQLRANHPRLAPDAWWTIASGLRGGKVLAGSDFRSSATEPLVLGSRDVRFDPATGLLEAITGPAQFGLSYDTLGNRLFCSNRNPAVLVQYEQADLNGNPLSGLIPSVVDVIPSGEKSQVHSLVNAWTTSNLHAGQFTAACGVLFHQFATDAGANVSRIFACEPTGSLVHCSRFEGSAATGARLAVESPGVEFLASRDPWFRPVNVIVCPDDGIAILDMHRAVIEHPQWVPEELKKRPDERWGNDSGRIFHVGTKGREASAQLASSLVALRKQPLGQRSDRELAQLVGSPNSWLRETARRLLLERAAKSVVEELQAIANNVALPEAGRTTAIYLAACLTEPQPPAAIEQLIAPENADASTSVRRAALRALRWHGGLNARLIDRVLALAVTTGDVQLLEECLRCLGMANDLNVQPATQTNMASQLSSVLTEQVARASGKTLPHLLVSASSALRQQPAALLTAVLQGLDRHSLERLFDADELNVIANACVRLTTAAGEAHPEHLVALFDLAVKMLDAATPQAKLAGIAVAGESLKIADRDSGRLDLPTAGRQQLCERVATIASDAQSLSSVRFAALPLLARSQRVEDRQLLKQLVQSNDLLLKTAALKAWAGTSDKQCDEFLMSSLHGSSPKLLQTVLELIGQRPARLNALAQSIAAGTLSPKQIGSVELKKLVTRASGEAKSQLTAALDSLVNSDRAKVLATYQSCLDMNSDATRGKAVFAKHCASCHKIDNVGVQVGPDISDSRTQQPLQLLTNILDPNRVIDNNYFRYVALTDEDQVFEGLIAEETEETIVIRGQNNTRTVLQRAKLQELKATGVSMMPDGLEAQIDPQAMADLIAYIKGWRYLDGSIPQ